MILFDAISRRGAPSPEVDSLGLMRVETLYQHEIAPPDGSGEIDPDWMEERMRSREGQGREPGGLWLNDWERPVQHLLNQPRLPHPFIQELVWRGIERYRTANEIMRKILGRRGVVANWNIVPGVTWAEELPVEMQEALFGLHDVVLSGAFATDAETVGGARIEATIDARDAVDWIGVPEEDLCELAGDVGIECEACPDDGQPFCGSLIAEDLLAERIDGTLEEVLEQNAASGCP